MSYLTLKAIHVSCIITSYALFVLRGIWMLHGSPLLEKRWVRIVPHVVDTLLLASAVFLAIAIRQYPFVNSGWLTAKVIGLVVYIGVGTVALKRGRTRKVRITAWIAAQLVFFYIVAVAMNHDPWPFGL